MAYRHFTCDVTRPESVDEAIVAIARDVGAPDV
jgi:hypothetical protein